MSLLVWLYLAYKPWLISQRIVFFFHTKPVTILSVMTYKLNEPKQTIAVVRIYVSCVYVRLLCGIVWFLQSSETSKSTSNDVCIFWKSLVYIKRSDVSEQVRLHVLENHKDRYIGSKWKQEAVKWKLLATTRLNGIFELRYLSNIFTNTGILLASFQTRSRGTNTSRELRDDI